MEGKLHCLIFICVLISLCRSQYWEQPYPFNFHVAPGIRSFNNPYRDLSRSEGTFLTLGSTPFSEINKPAPLRRAQSSNSAIIMPIQAGSGQFSKPSTLPDFETSSGSGNYDTTDFDEIMFPSHNPSRKPSISPSLPKQPSSERQTSCKIENAFIDYGGVCHTLLTQGPCSRNQWLIINEQEEPTCAQRPCQEGKLYYNGKCVSLSDTSVCGVSEILYVEFTGEVYCDCLPYYVYDVEARKCFAENDQGSCPFGQYLDLDSNDNLRCIENPCKRDDLIYNPKNNKCYKKVYKGPCKDEKGYQVIYNKDGTANCGSVHNRNIFEVPALTSCPAGSRRDFFGNCQKVLRLNPDSPQAYRVPSQQVSRYSQCPHGLTKYPDGSCRKINDLLGG